MKRLEKHLERTPTKTRKKREMWQGGRREHGEGNLRQEVQAKRSGELCGKNGVYASFSEQKEQQGTEKIIGPRNETIRRYRPTCPIN